jgi:Raf kinase inhibitor-like YbhB/YbcL family protein
VTPRTLMLAAMLAVAATPSHAVDHPDLFVMRSPDFADNGMLKALNAGTGTSVRGPWACGGRNVSPALAWSHAPAATKSYAILAEDPDAASGRGGPHWIQYGIPASVTSLPRGAADHFVGGAVGQRHIPYSGPCAEPGGKPHHFIFMVFALDLAPNALPSGLDLDGFRKAVEGHNLAEASLMARYWRPPEKKK